MEQDTAATMPVMDSGKQNNGKGWKIATAVASIVAVCGIGFGVYGFIDSNNKSQEIANLKTQVEEQSNIIADYSNQDDNLPDEEESQNKSYQVGDLVSLKNGTSWNVIKESDINNDYVILLSVDNINTSHSIKISDIKNYLLNDYKKSISSILGSDTDVRLLTLGDVSELSGIDSRALTPGTSLENGVTPEFLYKTTTLVSDDSNMILGENPDMICAAVPEYYETSPGRICVSTQTDTEPFRAVITVNKKSL